MAIDLWVFPYAGGGAAAFRPWKSVLEPEVTLRLVPLAGRDARFNEPGPTRHADARRYLREALFPQLEEPFAFYGHSMGAHLAWEVARDLRRDELPLPLYLFVSGASAPIYGPPGPLAILPHDELVERLRTLGGTPPEVLAHEELLEVTLPLIRRDFALAESFRYVAEPPLECPLSAWGGRDDVNSTSRMEAWGQETASTFRLRMLPGGHFFIREHASTLLEELKRDLARVTARVPVSP